MRRTAGLALVVLLAACAAAAPSSDAGSHATRGGTGVDGTVRERLAALVIDDHPAPGSPYDRSDWPTWRDPDGNRCDAREDALVAQSVTRAQVDPTDCSVIAGDWVSPYDGLHTTDPGALDVDHVVALENAHASGGWRWTAAERLAYANDPAVLVVVSAAANRSKGARTPDQWRPPSREAWCDFAGRWVGIKVTYRLTATSAERDALGQMLDTCGG